MMQAFANNHPPQQVFPQNAEINLHLHEAECTKELYGDDIEMKYFQRRYLPENNEIVNNIVHCSWKIDGLINEYDDIDYETLKRFLIEQFRKVGKCTYYLSLLISGDAYNNCKNTQGKWSGDVAIKPKNVFISSDEEECIRQTGIDKSFVTSDKTSTSNFNKKHQYNQEFNDYLGCYVEKLFKKGRLAFTKSVFIKVPGYSTPYEIKSAWCNQDYYSERYQRPCAQRV
ncbi:hypothetical protein FQA39_LY11743 [Lamprigera yunnana]|nr:hypothetical protein FQA39_LY11743 [Lamprigera yunnana]